MTQTRGEGRGEGSGARAKTKQTFKHIQFRNYSFITTLSMSITLDSTTLICVYNDNVTNVTVIMCRRWGPRWCPPPRCWGWVRPVSVWIRVSPPSLWCSWPAVWITRWAHQTWSVVSTVTTSKTCHPILSCIGNWDIQMFCSIFNYFSLSREDKTFQEYTLMNLKTWVSQKLGHFTIIVARFQLSTHTIYNCRFANVATEKCWKFYHTQIF